MAFAMVDQAINSDNAAFQAKFFMPSAGQDLDDSDERKDRRMEARNLKLNREGGMYFSHFIEAVRS